MGKDNLSNDAKFIFMKVYFVIILVKVTDCAIFHPVASVNPLLEPIAVIQARSKLLCVATCGTFEDCLAVHYNTSSSDCALLHVLTSSCPTVWESSPSSQLMQKTGIKPVTLPVFRTSSGTGAKFYSPWISDSYTSSCSQDVFDTTDKISFTYKHVLLKFWGDLNIIKVQLVLLKNAIEVVKLVFDGQDSTNMNWFSKSRILESSFTDLVNSNAEISVEGFAGARRFYIRGNHLTCLADSGWLCLKEENYNCLWENKRPYPSFLYSTTGKVIWWLGSNDIGQADDFVISLVVEV